MVLLSGFYTNNTLGMAHCIGTCKEEGKDQESIQVMQVYLIKRSQFIICISFSED